MTKQPSVKIELTPEQKKKIKDETGEDVSSLDLTIQELEERVAPLRLYE